uniref:Leucine--tRNA ligase n=1 Tax=Lygus hesperus TaxID=30085 RepID=A0A0A9X8M5_LYGHE
MSTSPKAAKLLTIRDGYSSETAPLTSCDSTKRVYKMKFRSDFVRPIVTVEESQSAKTLHIYVRPQTPETGDKNKQRNRQNRTKTVEMLVPVIKKEKREKKDSQTQTNISISQRKTSS